MSKIGKQLVKLPQGVEFSFTPGKIILKGVKGTVNKNIPKFVQIKTDGDSLSVSVDKKTKQSFSDWGTARSILASAVKGVTEGWQKKLELVGTGYRAEVRGDVLVLTVGYSHTIDIKAPEDIKFSVEKNIITVDGADKEKVGQISAVIRSKRPPEPYKGKGIKYIDEIIRRKAGKAAKAAGA